MALPTYDKSKRKKAYQVLPKGAYVVIIKDAKEEKNQKNSGSHLKIAFDIAEGEYAGFYMKQFENNTNEDKRWPNDAVYRLTVPQSNSADYIYQYWNNFFADLEDSNNGFVFGGDPATLKGKKIGGKFHNEQSEGNDGTVYDHIRMKWTCVADDVRKGKAGAMPKDKLISGESVRKAADTSEGFMDVPAGAEEEGLPF